MSTEIELVSDGEGIALFGDPKAIELFLVSEGIDSKELDLKRILPKVGTAAAVVEAGGLIAANAGRWVQVTEKSAHLLKTSSMMTGSVPGLTSRAVFTDGAGKITGLMEVVTGSGQFLANPALLAGVGGLMAQVAMQQAMDEVTEYLAVIDKKVDDILRAQKDAVLADMIAVGFVIEEAMTLRENVGHVSETTWSKVQATTMTIARTQAYALRQLDAMAEKLEGEKNVDALAATSKLAERTVQEWLVVLARCFQLSDAIAVLELDRVLDSAPDELDRHRLGLKEARQNRLDVISRSTTRLLARMDAAAEVSNFGVLMNPINSRVVVEAANHAGGVIVGFHELLGVSNERQALEAKRWVHAAEATRDQVIEAGAEGVQGAIRAGNSAFDRARKFTGKVAGDVSERLLRPRGDEGHE